ncbi:MAG: LysM domain-containing protein, partial [Caldilineaceae bacterium]
LAAANGLGEHSVLQIGQLLRIPGQPAAESADTVAQAESLPQTHVVAPGETIITIAQRYSLAWGELLRINNLDDSTILQVGQVITLR